MTVGLAHAFGPTVRVNAVMPGPFLTTIARTWDMDVFAERARTFPMRRAGQSEEIAGAALYLASDASTYTTGSILAVDGGAQWSMAGTGEGAPEAQLEVNSSSAVASSRHASQPATVATRRYPTSNARSASRSSQRSARTPTSTSSARRRASAARSQGTAEGVSRRCLHLLNLPAGSDIRGMRQQLARMERRLNQLSDDVAELDERRIAVPSER